MSTQALRTAVTGAPPPPKDRELTPFEVFRNKLNAPSFMNDLALMLGSEQRAMTFVRVVLTAVQKTPALLAADRKTLLLSCLSAARDKLMPDGREAVLNIFNTKVKEGGREFYIEAVQYMPMVGGLLKKLYDSGLVTMVDAAAVYEKDEFDYTRGDDPKIVHRPSLEDKPGEIVAAYCVIKLKNGEVKREVMPRRDIETVRSKSRQPNGMMWKDFPDQGAIKSVIRRAYKQMPSAPELDAVLEADAHAMGFSGMDLGEGGSASPVEQNGSGQTIEGEATPEQQAKVEHKPIEGVPTKVEAGDRELVEKASVEEQAKPKDAKASPVTYAAVRDQLERATTREEFDLAVDAIRGVASKAQKHELASLSSKILVEKFAGQ